MDKNAMSIGRRFCFLLLPILAIALHYGMSGILLYGFYSFFTNVLQLTHKQFAAFYGWTEIFVNFVLIILFFAVYRWVFQRDRGEKSGLPDAKGTAMSLIAGAGISGVSYLWIMLAKNIPAFQESLSAMEAANKSIESGSGLELILTVVIVAPLIEELLFRGIVFRSLQKVFPAWISIMLSATMFGAYHINLVQAVYATFMGIVAGIIYHKTNRLIYPMIVHAANNFIGAMQSFIPSNAGSLMVDVFSLIMIIPMCYTIYHLLKNNTAKQGHMTENSFE